MTLLEVPWLDCAIATSVIGSLWVSQVREPNRAGRLGLFFTGTAFACTFMAWLSFYLGTDAEAIGRASLQPYIFGSEVLTLDELSAPLVPAVALLHLHDRPRHGADQDAAVLVLVVAGLGGDPPGHLQLPGVMVARRASDTLHRPALLRAEESLTADTGLSDSHGPFRGADGARLGGG